MEAGSSTQDQVTGGNGVCPHFHAAIELIGQPANVIAALRERLAKRNSSYEAVMSALLALSRARLDQATLAVLRAEPDPEPDDLEALDAAWIEQEVRFGPGTNANDATLVITRLKKRCNGTSLRPSLPPST